MHGFRFKVLILLSKTLIIIAFEETVWILSWSYKRRAGPFTSARFDEVVVIYHPSLRRFEGRNL
uniref:Uncharacterized protein n=1 Tax=Salix viminalis TaxID=40686 RepID=A0A6N2MT36_SALVM